MHSWRVSNFYINTELIHESINGPHWPPHDNPGALLRSVLQDSSLSF